MNRYYLSQLSEKVQSLLDKIDGLRLNQSCDCRPSCELENVELDGIVYSVITRAVDNLINYYTKTETNALLSSIHQFVIRQVDALPEPSVHTMYTLYLVPSDQQRPNNVTDEFITVNRNGSYVWEQVGTSPMDLSDYVTEDELNSILSDYITSESFLNAISGLSDRIDNLHEVKYTTQTLTGPQRAQARQNIGAGTYTKPSSGIPASDLANGVIPDVSQFITKTVNDLVNYYTKSETYTKQEVQTLIAGIPGFTYELAPMLPEASANTMWKMYLIPSVEPKVKNEKDEFITVMKNGSYAWEQVGSTAIDLSNYVTIEALNTALGSYVTSEAFTTALAAKANRAQNAVEGDLANLDANGNPVDSGLAFKAIPRLPEEYQEVERIGSPNSNAKVIDTGVPGNIAGLEIEAKINYPKNLSAVGYLWGNARGGSYNGFYCLKQSRTSTVYNFSINKRYSVGVTISPHNYNTVHTLRLFPDSSAYRLVVDGEGDGYIIGNTSEGQENNKTILLFGSYSSPRVAAVATVYFYYFIARANGVELCHLIPAVRKADNAYGLYDLVSGTFKMGGETAEETHYYNIGDLVTTASAQRLVKGETPMPVKTDIKRVDGLTEEIARIDGRIDAAAARDYFFAVVGETSYAAVQSAMQEGKRVIAFKDVEGQYGVGTTVFTPFFANDFECIFMGVEAVDETRFGLRFLVLGSSGWQEDTYETLDRVFWAEYGVTSYQDIDAALNDGKMVFCKAFGSMVPFTSKDSDGTIHFTLWEEEQDQYGDATNYLSYIIMLRNPATVTGNGWSSTIGNRQPFIDTTSETALTPQQDENIMKKISLHKVSKTGNYNDLLNKPSIPVLESMTASEVTAAVNTAWDNVMNA